ncbi:MAG: rhodanese-like domain-containing protein [Phycisphaerae bacterium]
MTMEIVANAVMNVDPVWELHPHTVHKLKNQAHEIFILDVREPKEWEHTRIEGAILIPLDQLLRRLEELKPARGKRIVVYCHHGDRSLLAAELLRESGFAMVHSLAGGIDAWSVLVDPTVRRY